MAYTTNQRLRYHKMSVHEGIKFDCPHCEIKLANPSSLQRHIQKIHIEKRVRVCGNRYIDRFGNVKSQDPYAAIDNKTEAALKTVSAVRPVQLSLSKSPTNY